MTKIKKPSKKTTLVVLIAVILAIGLSIFLIDKSRDKTSDEAAQTAAQQAGINLALPTAEDAQRVDDNKKKIVERQTQESNQTPTTPGTKKSVIPVVTYAGQYGQDIEVGGYVDGIFEDGGTCTATFTQGSVSKTRTVQSVKNTNAVDCPAMIISTLELGQKGTWKVFISYSSSTSEGKSSAREIEVQ